MGEKKGIPAQKGEEKRKPIESSKGGGGQKRSGKEGKKNPPVRLCNKGRATGTNSSDKKEEKGRE